LTIRFITEYASPTTIQTTVSVANTGFLREVLVIIKDTTDQTTITTLTSKPITEIKKSITGLFDGGMSKVSYIKRINADLPTGLEINANYFTILLDGFSAVELGASNLGDFVGVVWQETNNINEGIENKIAKIYNTLLDGYTLGYTAGIFLSQNDWSNLQYTPTNKNVFVVDNLGTANTLFLNRLSFWGRDDFEGTRLMALFADSNGITKHYIEKQIAVELQTNNLNLLSSDLKNTIVDAKIVENSNKNYINDNYLLTGLISAFIYTVSLSTKPNAFDSDLDLVVPAPIWKIDMTIKQLVA
jgi:hypothetical protein